MWGRVGERAGKVASEEEKTGAYMERFSRPGPIVLRFKTKGKAKLGEKGDTKKGAPPTGKWLGGRSNPERDKDVERTCTSKALFLKSAGSRSRRTPPKRTR